MKRSSGYIDKNMEEIFEGDRLRSKWGYDVIVFKDEKFGNYFGKLVSNSNLMCKDMPYSIMNSQDFEKVKTIEIVK